MPTRTSPLPGPRLEGYAEEISIEAGKTARFMVSGAGAADVRLARLIHGDPSPAGPGARDTTVDWGNPTRISLTEQVLDLGSHIEVPHNDALNPVGDFTLALWFRPTLLGQAWHTLVSKWVPDDLGLALYVVADRILAFALSRDGRTAEWVSSPDFVQRDVWQFAAVTYEVEDGRLGIHQAVLGSPDLSSHEKLVTPGRVHPTRATLLFGASFTEKGGGLWAHFNGKLARPALFQEALESDRLRSLAGGAAPHDVGALVAHWDLSRGVEGRHVVDVGPHGLDGVAVNTPARAVTGPFWSGSPDGLYTSAPEAYDAVHLHEDDLDDAGWEPTLAVSIPADATPGIYALQLAQEGDALSLPFVLRSPKPRTELAILFPTLTWQAYGSNSQPWSFTEDGVVDRAPCLYNVHADGSMVYYCTRRKPTRSGNPSAGFRQWGAHTITASLYLVDWLEQASLQYDAFTDEDLHHQGVELLLPFRCLVLGSHPEYWTAAMLDGLQEYLARGGRIVYLGGNGLWWVASLDPARPYLMEVRKEWPELREGFVNTIATAEPGERLHSTTLELGGRWSSRGREPRGVLGVEYCAESFRPPQPPPGFARTSASFEKCYSFVFDGVDDGPIGNFGLNLGSAAGFEMDAVPQHAEARDDTTVVLARATHDAFAPSLFFAGGVPAADIALRVLPGGAAVFAAGSVTWTGSLSHNGYENSVSAITGNVIRRFLTVPRGKEVLSEQAPREPAAA